MKNFTQIGIIFLFFIANSSAQQEKGIFGQENWLNNWTEFKSNKKDYGEATQILTGNISQYKKLYSKDVYLLLGDVFVTNNAVLEIEQGTVIIGDKKTKGSLTITKGSKIIANGSETNPIVFTSNRGVKKAGDWGGIVILGDAPNSKFGNGSVTPYYPNLHSNEYANVNYGGQDSLSNSGLLKNVRIEYAGRQIGDDRYFSGLLLASVGSKTRITNVMVSNSGGNSFEVWGGKLVLNKLVSYRSNGNDFEFNQGTEALLENSLAIRSPYISNTNGSRCLKIKSYDDKADFDFNRSKTFVSAKNLTFINESENLESDIKMNLIREAIHVGENALLTMSKSVVSGFNPAVILENKIIINQENLERIKFSEMYFNNCNGNIFVEYDSNNEDLENWYGNSAFSNVYSNSANYETFIETRRNKRPDFRLRINKIIASNEVDSGMRVD